MKKLKGRWLVPAAALILTLSIGSAAFAATDAYESDSAATTATAPSSDATAQDSSTSDKGAPWGKQRSDETPLTGDVLAKVEAAALAEAGSGSTLVRAETDADGNAKYEAHVTKADGTHVTVYLDENYSVVSIEDAPAGGGHGHGARGTQTDSDDNTN